VGKGTVHLGTGTRVIGTILNGFGSIYEDPNGTDQTSVEGRIWSRAQDIIQYGGTVISP